MAILVQKDVISVQVYMITASEIAHGYPLMVNSNAYRKVETEFIFNYTYVIWL